MPRMQRKDVIPSNGNGNGNGDSAAIVPAAATNGSGGGVGTHPACASCKHQRKKCAEDCILAAVFPAEKTREFQAVHKVFGVSNVIKMMRRVEARDRERVAESLIWEAASRENDPVLGALRQFQRLQEEKKQLEKELGLYKPQPPPHPNHINGNSNGNHQQTMMVRPQGGVVYKQAQAQAPPLLSCWSNGSSNGVKLVNGNGHNNSNMCNTTNNNNNNVVGLLQGGFPTLHSSSNNNGNHHGEMINVNNKAAKKGGEEAAAAAVGSFIARQSPPPQVLQQQHILHHQHHQPPQFHHPQFYHQLDLPAPGHFPAYNFNGQAMENNIP